MDSISANNLVQEAQGLSCQIRLKTGRCLLSKTSLLKERSAPLKLTWTPLLVMLLLLHRAIKLKEGSSNKSRIIMEEFSHLMSPMLCQNQEVLLFNNHLRFNSVTALLLHSTQPRPKTQAAPEIQMEIQVWLNRTSCSSPWILSHLHCSPLTPMVLLRNRLVSRTSSRRSRAQEIKVPKKKYNLFKLINSTLRDWRIKLKLSRKVELSQDQSTPTIRVCRLWLQMGKMLVLGYPIPEIKVGPLIEGLSEEWPTHITSMTISIQ